jgi:biotin transport system substrate-specific component
MLIVYAPGILWLKRVMAASWVEAFTIGFTPFIIGDIIKSVLAVSAARSLRKGAAKALNG